jgi:metal-responsive CopG/Arc/MetJ family transcriptional regulator
MKTAISLPDELFESADALARKLGVSRSRLVREALAEYVAKHKHARITERLNEVYAAEDGVLDPAVREAARQTLRRSQW